MNDESQNQKEARAPKVSETTKQNRFSEGWSVTLPQTPSELLKRERRREIQRLEDLFEEEIQKDPRLEWQHWYEQALQMENYQKMPKDQLIGVWKAELYLTTDD